MIFMEKCLFAMALGAVSLLFLPMLPNSADVLLVAIVCLLFSIKWSIMRPVALFLLVMSWSVYQAQSYLNQRLPTAIEGQTFRVLVEVNGLPEMTKFGQRVRVQPLELRSKLSYQLPQNSYWQLNSQKIIPFRPNQQWQLTVTLKRPHGTVSMGAFDYEAWLLSEHITATGKISRAVLISEADWSINEWRLQVRERFQQAFVNNPDAGVALALLTGDRALVNDSSWDLYAATGTSHLMAISGTHVMLAAVIVAWLLMQLAKQYPLLFIHIPLQRLRLPVVLIVALAYGCLAGLSLPTLRTLVMLSLSVFIAWWQRDVSGLAILLRAFVLIVLWQPLSVHAIGFWLSFMAVAILIFWSGWQRQEHHWLAFSRLQLWLTLALLPLTLCFFGSFSLVSPLANLLAIPVITFMVVPLDLLGLVLGVLSTDLQIMAWQAAVWIVQALNVLLSLLNKYLWAQQFWVFSPLPLVFLTVACLIVLLPRGLVTRSLAMMLLLPVFFRWQTLPEGALRVSVIDVGQGLSVLLETQHHSLLYDTGANMNAGERIIVPYLRWSGVRQLDTLMISHNDSDHTGGADALLAQIPIKKAMYSAAPEGYTLAKNTSQQLCQAGQQWQWEQVNFKVLSPIVGGHYDKDNNRSCVLRVSGQGFSLLLTGDMEAPAEKILLANTSSTLASQVLVLGHHGSKTSSTSEFLAAVKPQLAIVSAGYRNQFAHPSPSVIERLRSNNIAIDNTINQGTLRYLFAPTQAIQKEVGRERGHYWLNAP